MALRSRQEASVTKHESPRRTGRPATAADDPTRVAHPFAAELGRVIVEIDPGMGVTGLAKRIAPLRNDRWLS